MVNSLLERYKKEWSELQRRPLPVGTARPTNPLLLDVPPAYFDADYKVMVFGQETNDWEGAFPHQGGVAHMLETYQKFYNTGYCYTYGGQFWNGIKDFKSRLQERCRLSGKSMHLLWNNVIKIGKEGEKSAPPQVILDWQEKWFDVVRFEITELRPDIVVFFSGWKRDCYITKALRSATFEALNQWSIKELARVTASGILPEGRTIRAEHPTPLYHQGRAYFNEYMAEIVAAIQI